MQYKAPVIMLPKIYFFLCILDPASLSCDVWVLLKKWHPQRRHHREKGYVTECSALISH